MTYEELKKINESIKVVDIKGKNYAQVNERVKAFRQLYPNGSIIPKQLKDENGVCTYEVEVRDDEGKVLAVGHANEKESASYINKTSYIENCETSAVGRALGFLGIGIDVEIASAEEVQNATANEAPNIIKARDHVGGMVTFLQKNGMSLAEIAVESGCQTEKILQSWMNAFDNLYSLECKLSEMCEQK